MSAKKRGLGRGLDALLATSQKTTQSENADAAEALVAANELKKLPIEFLQPGKYQPRKDMSPDAPGDMPPSILRV